MIDKASSASSSDEEIILPEGFNMSSKCKKSIDGASEPEVKKTALSEDAKATWTFLKRQRTTPVERRRSAKKKRLSEWKLSNTINRKKPKGSLITSFVNVGEVTEIKPQVTKKFPKQKKIKKCT